jgi:hypothetical protein
VFPGRNRVDAGERWAHEIAPRRGVSTENRDKIRTPMERRPVASSSIASVGYDPGSFELEIEFHNGRVYRYLQVPAAAYRLLLQAPSIGEYVNRVIKPRFAARSV